MKRIHSFSIVLIILLIMSGFVTAAMNNSPEYPVMQANRSVVPPDTTGVMVGTPARIDQKSIGGSSGQEQPGPDQFGLIQANLLTEPNTAEFLGGGGGYFPATGWNRYCFNLIVPNQNIKKDTHPAVVSRKPGTVDIIYYHPDGSIWWSNRTGGRASDPVWLWEQQINSWTGTMFSPGVYSYGSNQFTVMETDTSHNIWNAAWGEGVGMNTWIPLVSDNDVNSTPAALVRHGGNDFELVYFNVSNYLIWKNFNYSHGWTRHAMLIASQPINDGISLVSTSPDSFTIIFADGKIWAITKSDTSDEFGIWNLRYSNFPVYSYVTASTRKFNDTQTQATLIDVVYNKYSPGDYYWSHSDDNGITWKNETYLGTPFNSPLSVISPRYNRLEIYQADTNHNLTAVMGFKGPDHTKIGVFRPSTHVFYLDYNRNGAWNGASVDRQYNFGISGDTPVSGDWRGDGITRIGIYRNSTHMFYLDNNGNGVWNGASVDRLYNFGLAKDIPVSGDWNGDGTTKIGVFRPSTHTFYLDYNGNGTWNGNVIDRQYNFGILGDTPLSGDWNADGKTEIGIYRNSTHMFYLDYNGNGIWNGTSVDRQYNFGITGDIPITGDWNIDGKTEIGVFRNSTHVYYLDYNGNGAWNGASVDRQYNFGITGDKPISGTWG
jgi:hypothetical protein